MAKNETRPFNPGQPPSQEQLEAFSRITKMLKGSQEYVPVMKSLDAIKVDYKVIDVMLGDTPTECLVVPLQDLMYREWCHMSGQDIKQQREGQ